MIADEIEALADQMRRLIQIASISEHGPDILSIVERLRDVRFALIRRKIEDLSEELKLDT